MAKAKKCDRCGKYYDKPKFDNNYEIYDRDRSISLDICDECYEGLIYWMKECKIVKA